MLLENGVTIWQDINEGGAPVDTYFILTEDNFLMLNENGDYLVTEDAP